MINTTNTTNFKQLATATAVLDSHYLDIISNVQGTSKTGYNFNDVLTASIQYLTYNSFHYLQDSEYTLTHFKGILDHINQREQFGYRPMLEVPYNGLFEYNKVTYLREAYCFIQLAYYLNENDLTKTDFFKYTMHYSTTNQKLDDALYTDDLSYLHKEYEKIDKNGKDRYKHSITKHFFGCMLLILNDLNLPTTHFNEVTKENRTYNAMVQTPRDWRKVFPFELLEYDIKSAFPVFVDHLIGSNVGANVYELIMQTYEVDRPQAKILFNTWLNRTKYKTAEEFTAFFAPIYKEHTPKLVAYLTDKSNPIWQKMNELEKRCIDFLTQTNNIYNGTRLHDAYFIINNDYYNKINQTDFSLATFGRKLFAPSKLEITLNKTKNIAKGYEPAIHKHLNMSFANTQLFNKDIDFVNVGDFTIYQKHFECYKSNFNIGINGIYEDGQFNFYTNEWFLERIQNLTNIVFHLNTNVSQIRLISYLDSVLTNIKSKGIWSFNTDLLIEHLLCNITEPQTELCDYVYHSERSIDLYTFQKYYYDALRKANMIFQCKSVFHIVEHSYKTGAKTFINLKDIFDSKNYKSRNSTFVELVDAFNKANGFESIGKAFKIRELYELGQKSHNPISNSLYRVVKKMACELNTTQKTQIRLFNSWLQFKQDTQTIKHIYDTMHHLINDASIVKVKEVKTKTNKVQKVIQLDTTETLTFEQRFATSNAHYTDQWNDAFGTEQPDLSNSVLNVIEDHAFGSSLEFFRSWILFKYKPNDKSRFAIEKQLNKIYNRELSIENIIAKYTPKPKPIQQSMMFKEFNIINPAPIEVINTQHNVTIEIEYAA